MLSWNDSPMYVYSAKFSTRIEELLPDWHLWIWDWIYLSSPCMTSPRWLFVIAHPFVNFKPVKDNSPYVARRLEDLSSGLYKSTSWSTHQPIPGIYNPSHHKVQHVEKRESRIVKKNAIFVMEVKNVCLHSFPGTSVLFLYRNVKETVVSFQRVMAAFTTLARFFTNDQVNLQLIYVPYYSSILFMMVDI